MIMIIKMMMTGIKSRSVRRIYRKMLNIGNISIGSYRLYSKMINILIILIITTIIDISKEIMQTVTPIKKELLEHSQAKRS